MTKKEAVIIACAPIASVKENEIVAGSIRSICVKCNAAIWIAPSGQKIVAEEGATPICSTCALIDMKIAEGQGEKVDVRPLNPVQVHEVFHALLKKKP